MVSTWAAVGNMPVVERLMFQQQYIKLWIILVPKWKVISSVCLISPTRTLPSSSSAHYGSPSDDGGWQHWDSKVSAGAGRGRRGVGRVLPFRFIQCNVMRASQKLVFCILNCPMVYPQGLPRKKQQKWFGRGMILSVVDPPWSASTFACCFLAWDLPKHHKVPFTSRPVLQHSSHTAIYWAATVYQVYTKHSSWHTHF